MRTLCPNFDREDGLETVLEVPMPEELFSSDNNKNGAWKSVKSSLLLRSPQDTRSSLTCLFGGREGEIEMLLGVMGASLIPLPTSDDHNNNVLHHPISKLIKNQSIEAAMAKYIVKQYTAAIGGETSLSKIESMYAMGKVKMNLTEFSAAKTVMGKRKKKIIKLKNVNNNNGGEMGGFVLWKKGFNQWSLELVVSGSKVSAGCDGNITWKQNPCLSSHSSKPSGPLRRFLQGLDPKAIANLFAGSVCVGEKCVNGEECFVLRVETESLTFKYTVLGCFSQRSGLLIQLEDVYQVKGKNGIVEGEDDEVLWETRSESLIEDYKSVEGVLIGHRGRTRVSLLKYDECCESDYTKSVMEEEWEIEEVGFNVKGLCSDFFLCPGDLCDKEDEEESEVWFGGYNSQMLLTLKGINGGGNWKVKSSKVIAPLEDFGEFEGY